MTGLLKIYLSYYIGKLFQIRRKPKVLQIPVTSRCNSRCLTCGIWKYSDRKDIDEVELRRVLNNSFFSQVEGVGINGGEPTLHGHFVEVIKAVLVLPKLKNIFVISNGINSERTLNCLQEVFPLCKERQVRLNLQISVDGVGEVHNKVRGVKSSFDKILHTLHELYNNKERYLDNLNIGCTISKYNVDYLVQIEDFFSEYDIPIFYHLAVPNKRIHNFNDAPFSVFADKHATQMAKEFFHMKSGTATTLSEKIRCYLIFLYLAGYTHKRLFLCDYLYRDLTIDEHLDTFLCATASDKVGNMIEGIPSYEQYNYMAKDTKAHCDTCIHYASIPNLRGIYTYLVYKLKTYKWISRYK